MAAFHRLALLLAVSSWRVGGMAGADGATTALARERAYNIRVCARLRPLPPDAFSAETDSAQTYAFSSQRKHVVLPLHQRLLLLRASQHCNQTDAQRLLWESRGGLADPFSAAAVKVPRGDDADVEMAEGGATGGWRETPGDEAVNACVLSTAGGAAGHILMCCPAGAGIRQFTLDHVLTADASQPETYAAAASECVERFLAGQNACIFAYGQTGSGKSHAMFGASDESAHSVSGQADACPEASGITPRACSEVLAEAAAIRARGGSANVSLTFVELYGETISDLLADNQDSTQDSETDAPRHSSSVSTRPPAHRVKDGRARPILAPAVLRGRHAVHVQTPEECAGVLARGLRNRKQAATGMNQRSSRAHTVLVIHFETDTDSSSSSAGRLDGGGVGNGAGKRSGEGADEAARREAGRVKLCRTLCLVDLGGAEQVSKSILSAAGAAVIGASAVDARLQEAAYINLGLLALKKCVRALVADDPHVPFNDAKLTMVLRGALKGECATGVLITCSSEDCHAPETVEGLRFGETLSSVRLLQSATPALDATAEHALSQLEGEIDAVQEAIRAHERWETTWLPGQANDERRTVTNIVGAEVQHKKLEALMMRRRILTGAP